MLNESVLNIIMKRHVDPEKVNKQVDSQIDKRPLAMKDLAIFMVFPGSTK